MLSKSKRYLAIGVRGVLVLIGTVFLSIGVLCYIGALLLEEWANDNTD